MIHVLHIFEALGTYDIITSKTSLGVSGLQILQMLDALLKLSSRNQQKCSNLLENRKYTQH